MTYTIASYTLQEVEARLREGGFRVTMGGDTDIAGAAAFIGKDKRTLRAWRSEGRGPVSIQYPSGAVFYPIAELLAFRILHAGTQLGDVPNDEKYGDLGVAPVRHRRA